MSESKITREMVEQAIPGTHGLLKNIAEKLGLTYEGLYGWINREEDRSWFDELVKREQEILCDVAEDSLFEDIRKGDVKSRNFFLRTKGRHRGYVPKVEQDVSGIETGAAVINVIVEKDKDVNKK